jgi:toxin FitB
MIVLDTNVLSELMRPEPSARVSNWIAEQLSADLFTTSITEAEIFYGIELLPRGKRREGLLMAAEAMFTEDLEGRVLNFGSDAARAFARIASTRRSRGKPISNADAQVAAIARVRKATLATRNLEDFEGCEIELVNPWYGKVR